MSHEAQHESIKAQFQQLKEKLESPAVPEAEKQLTLLQMQSLMIKHNQLLDIQTRQMKEFDDMMKDYINKMR